MTKRTTRTKPQAGATVPKAPPAPASSDRQQVLFLVGEADPDGTENIDQTLVLGKAGDETTVLNDLGPHVETWGKRKGQWVGGLYHAPVILARLALTAEQAEQLNRADVAEGRPFTG